MRGLTTDGGQEPAQEGRPLSVQRLWIPGKLPGLNQMLERSKSDGAWRHARRFSRKAIPSSTGYESAKKAWTSSIASLARNKLRPVRRARLSFFWVEPASSGRDMDNVASAKKFIIDGLVWAGILPGDRRQHIASPSVDSWDEGYTGSEYGVWVTVEEVAPRR